MPEVWLCDYCDGIVRPEDDYIVRGYRSEMSLNPESVVHPKCLYEKRVARAKESAAHGTIAA